MFDPSANQVWSKRVDGVIYWYKLQLQHLNITAVNKRISKHSFISYVLPIFSKTTAKFNLFFLFFLKKGLLFLISFSLFKPRKSLRFPSSAVTSRNRGEKIKQRLRQLLTLGQNKQSSTEQVRELRLLEDIVKMSQSNESVSHECVLKMILCGWCTKTYSSVS